MTNLGNSEKITLYMEERKYDFSIVKIINMKQVSLYTQHNVMPIDMFLNDGKLCFVYNKRDTIKIFEQWDSQNPNKRQERG